VNPAYGASSVPESRDQVDIETINRSMERMATGSSQEEILDVLLSETSQYVDRAILFRQDQGEYRAWKCRGFSNEQCYSVSPGEADSMILQAAAHLQVISREENILQSLPWLRGLGPLPGFCFCVPMSFGQYVPLVLYGDSRRRTSVASVELLARLTVLHLQNHYQALLLQQAEEKEEAPVSSGEMQDIERESEALPEEAWEIGAESETGETAGLSEVDIGALDDSETELEVTWSSHDEEDLQEAQPGTEDKGEEAEAVSGETEAEAEDMEEPLAEEEELLLAATEPEDLSPEEEEAMHAEARRLARLLVAEIKLYNEAAVEEGRQESDLYRLLRTDIDRSRNMYEKRVHPTIKSQADYFHSELVRVLAKEDPELMGSDYPGTKVPNPIGPVDSQEHSAETTLNAT
jgi:hypothetical protein